MGPSVWLCTRHTMKRATDIRDDPEGISERPSKQLHTDDLPEVMDLFTNDAEFKAKDLADAEELPKDRHVLGQVFMVWPASNDKCKIQIKTGPDILDVVFEGPGVGDLGFLPKDMVRLALKGGKKEIKRAGSSMTLPFRLIFSNGAIIQLLTSPKREEDKLVDLFKGLFYLSKSISFSDLKLCNSPAIEERKRKADDDWFYPPSTLDNPEVEPSTSVSPGHLEQGGPQRSWSNAQVPDNFTRQDAQDMTSNDDSVHVSGVNKSQLHYHHSIDSGLRDAFQPVGRPADNDLQGFEPLVSVDFSTPVALPSQQAPLEQAPHHKDRRIRKRDMRHNQRSTSGTASDATLAGADKSGSGGQKPQGKKKPKRLGEKSAKVEGAKVGVESSSTPPPPPRDPALDLVAGFHSDKVFEV